MTSLVRRAIALVAALVATVSVTGVGVPFAGAAAPSVQVTAFGMHWLNRSHSYPAMTFGTARIWDMGVTWADLQPDPPPTPSLPVVGATTPAPWNQTALSALDNIIDTYVKHHVQPLLTLGVTPAWAAHSCTYNYGGHDWGIGTCAPADTSVAGPWGQYIDFLANRYQGKLRYFELWNEPSLANGYNDSIATLAQMQQTAHTILQRYSGDQLVSPGIVFTNGSPTKGYSWLQKFLGSPGGTAYDITGLHLYPGDSAARGGYGPEWSFNTGLVWAKKALAKAKVSGRPIWDTETNVGRVSARTGYRDGSAGAGAVVRTYVLAVENHIARTFWYAADDRVAGGTWLEKSNFHSLSPAGAAFQTTERLIVGKAIYGCTAPRGTARGMYACRFGTNSGHKTLLVVWSDSRSTRWHLPKHVTGYYTATGSHHRARGGQAMTITSTPVFITGAF